MINGLTGTGSPLGRYHQLGWGFEIGERLQRDCWRVARRPNCLREWREPDDARADVDDHCDPPVYLEWFVIRVAFSRP